MSLSVKLCVVGTLKLTHCWQNKVSPTQFALNSIYGNSWSYNSLVQNYFNCWSCLIACCSLQITRELRGRSREPPQIQLDYRRKHVKVKPLTVSSCSAIYTSTYLCISNLWQASPPHVLTCTCRCKYHLFNDDH